MKRSKSVKKFYENIDKHKIKKSKYFYNNKKKNTRDRIYV